MSARTVRTQAELDRAIADEVSTIHIESPAGVWLTLTSSGSSRVVAWGSSRVVARGFSRVEARDSSHVVAWGSSRVVARGFSRVEARDSSRVEAGAYTAVHLHSARATVRGGVVIDLTKIDLTDPAQWLDYHGVKTSRGLSPREWSLPPGKHWTSTVQVPWHNGVMCWASDPAHGYACTRAVGHTGRHNAATLGPVVAVWEQS